MRWDGKRAESVTCRLVEMPGEANGWAAGLVGPEEPMFTGGSIEWSDSAALGASGSLSYTGGGRPDTSRMVRISYAASDESGGSEEAVLGTFVMEADDPSCDMGRVDGSVRLLSVLHVAASKLFPRPYVIGRGCNCVERAAGLLRSLHIPVAAAWSGRLLRQDIVMEAGESYLDAANRLLAAAGFLPCQPDAYGGALMRPAQAGSEPVWTFRTDASSVVEPKVVCHDGLSGAPNAVHLTWEGDGVSCWTSAVNDDPLSPSSVRNVGFESGVHERANDPEGETAAEVLESVKAQAAERLAAACSGYSTCQVSHPWVPVSVGDPVRVLYPKAGIDFAGCVSAMAAKWGSESHVTVATTVGRRVAATFSPTVRGGVL
uniref:Uncharacterized protein n=1 Tax=Muribaculaceae bacterium Z82 TaxID=2304548 RepID=A0A7C9NDR7_9BACT